MVRRRHLGEPCRHVAAGWELRWLLHSRRLCRRRGGGRRRRALRAPHQDALRRRHHEPQHGLPHVVGRGRPAPRHAPHRRPRARLQPVGLRHGDGRGSRRRRVLWRARPRLWARDGWRCLCCRRGQRRRERPAHRLAYRLPYRFARPSRPGRRGPPLPRLAAAPGELRWLQRPWPAAPLWRGRVAAAVLWRRRRSHGLGIAAALRRWARQRQRREQRRPVLGGWRWKWQRPAAADSDGSAPPSVCGRPRGRSPRGPRAPHLPAAHGGRGAQGAAASSRGRARRHVHARGAGEAACPPSLLPSPAPCFHPASSALSRSSTRLALR